jgi:DinB family protein
MQTDEALRNLLVSFLEGEAHLSLADALKGFPVKDINVKPRNVPYTFWHLLEHIRIAQWDIVDFVKNPNYKELRFPQDYWPAPKAKATRKDWLNTIARIEADTREMIAIVKDPATNLHARIPHGDGQTILREAILIVDHNSYHIGEFAILRQVQKNWKQR